MKTFILWAFLFPHHYQVCISSDVGTGCSHIHFTKAQAKIIGEMFNQAPIEAHYGVWVQDMYKPAHIEQAPDHSQPEVPSNNNKL